MKEDEYSKITNIKEVARRRNKAEEVKENQNNWFEFYLLSIN